MPTKIEKPATRREFIGQTVAVGAALSLGPTMQTHGAPFGEYYEHDAIGLADLVRRKDVKPEELLDAAIQRTEALNPKLNAIVTKMYDKARSTITAGLPDGTFTGVPFLLKDLGAAYAGVRYTMGSKLFANNVSPYDDELTKRYKQAGLVVFGRTNTPEFGLNVSTESAFLGPAHNPWDTQRSAGGSSGGAAAAVAARIIPMAHGNDGGGSIRIPSSCCGVFGMKPSRGRIPTGPGFGEIWEGFATDHALTLSVRDCAASLDATSAPEVGAPYGIPAPTRPFLKEVGANPGRLRIAYFTKAGYHDVHAECVKAVENAARLCESLGHIVEQQAPELNYEKLEDAMSLVVSAHTGAMLRQFTALIGKEVTADMVEPWTWEIAQTGGRASAVDFANTKALINQATRELARMLTQYDVILTPTLGSPPPELGYFDTIRLSYDEIRARHFDYLQFTWLYNLTGRPAMSVPLHWDDDGIPIGVQFAGRYADEATLFRLAGQLEQARPWRKRIPAITLSESSAASGI